MLLPHPKRRILSSVAIGTIPSFRCNTLIGTCCLFGCPSQFLLVIARSRLASLFWHASSGKSSFSVKLPFCPTKAHETVSSAPCTVALKTLHLNLKSTFAFQKCPTCAKRSKLQRFFFPSLRRKTASSPGGSPDILPSSSTLPPESLACCLRQAHL